MADVLDLGDPTGVFQFLLQLDWLLSEKNEPHTVDYPATFEALRRILNSWCAPDNPETVKKGESLEPAAPPVPILDPNVTRIFSKAINQVLKELPSKVYDVANKLVGCIAVDDDGNLTTQARMACLVLADIMEHHPLQVRSLIDYTTSQLYKILKRDLSVDHTPVYLVSVLLRISLTSDIGDKTLSKLEKVIVKAITQSTITIPISDEQLSAAADSNESTPSIILIVHYIQCLKNLLVLQTSSHYEQLLKFSASATSGTKMKPEALMNQQHQFQQNLLASHERIFHFGFKSQFAEVRSAMVELVANLLLNFVSSDLFNPHEYLIGLYPLPLLNLWEPSLAVKISDQGEPIVDVKRESNTVSNYDSEGIINLSAALLLNQIGAVESLMFYIQLEQIQSLQVSADRPLILCPLIDRVLKKFGELDNPAHVQNLQWARALEHWSTALKHVISESGSSCHETLAQYIVEKFSQTSSLDSSLPTSSRNKRESTIFGFGASKKKGFKGESSSRINLKSNPYQMKLLLDISLLLLPYGVDFNTVTMKKVEAADLQAVDDGTLAEEEEDATTSQKSNYLSTILLSYLGNESECIRNYSLQAITAYALINETASNLLILDVFIQVTAEFNQQIQDDKPQQVYKLFSYALALLALIKQSKITLLQNSTVAKVLSFCTQNLKSTTGLKSLKTGACWIILTSLVSLYRDSEFVKVNSSQFLVFWKNLLTSQLVTSGLNNSETAELRDVLCNLKLRTLSLACLLNYILALENSPELSRQLQFFLVKSHKYLLYLESSIESVGLVTSLNPQAFNEYDFNVNRVNNVLFSNGVDSTTFSEENQLVSLILYNKKIILQGFVKLAHNLKSDVNSSLVVFLSKVFSDVKGYSRQLSVEQSREKSKSSKKTQSEKLHHLNPQLVLLEEESNYNFGVTSKFELDSSVIDELYLLTELNVSELATTIAQFSSSVQASSHTQTQTFPTNENAFQTEDTWVNSLEKQIHSSTFHSIVNDPLTVLVGRYSVKHEYSPCLITSLVDLSIELFALVFPSLSYKIQFSLLEQLQAAVTTKNIDPLRKKALLVNLSVTLHTLFGSLHKRGHIIDESLVLLALNILDGIESQNENLTTILAEASGLASLQLTKAKTEEYLTSKINVIVETVNPLRRGHQLLVAAKIYQYSHVGFLDVYGVVSQLLKDSHPVMAFYALKATAALLEDATGKQSLVRGILQILHENFLRGCYGINSNESQLADLRYTHMLSIELLNSLKICITTLGPSIKEFDESLKEKVYQILYAYSLGFDCADQFEVCSTLRCLNTILQEILIFDNEFVAQFTTWYRRISEFIILHNMKLGVGSTRSIYLDSYSIFPFTTSNELSDMAFASLVEMTKIGIPTLDANSLNLAWISMELRPLPAAKELITLWVETHPEQNWFARLSALFRTSSRKLVGSFIELNYEQKMLPILQREKKKSIANNAVEFRDEEIENIVGSSGDDNDKNQPICWEFKLLIYNLLIKVLTSAESSEELLNSLKPKIQDIIRLSFLGTTTPILAIRLKGIQLLDKTLSLVGDMEDPLYPETSILEQQQAQIISALIPCFGADSDPDVIVEAIMVSSKFINLPRIKFYLKQRILNTMIYLLEEILSGKFLKFVYLESMAEYSRKAIQLAILNCWAVLRLRIDSMDDELAKELREILKKYSRLLILLWILVLKDLSTTKYNLPDSKELELYSKYWLNYVAVLSVSLESDASLIGDLLQEENCNFFYVMFCQCLESLIRGNDVSRVLTSVIRLLRVPELVNSLLDEMLFAEIVDLFDRLVLMESDVEIKCKVIDAVGLFFDALCEQEQKDEQKMLELMRVTMLPLFETFPFLRQDFNAENPRHQLSLKRCTSATSILLTKRQMTAIVHMVQNFPVEELPDLLSCILHIFGKIYEYGNELLISTILPHLKSVVARCGDMEVNLVGAFFEVIRRNDSLKRENNKINFIVTSMILATGSHISFTRQEEEMLSKDLVEGLLNDVLAATCIQSIKSLIHSSGNGNECIDLLTKDVLRLILSALVGNEDTSPLNDKLAFEVVLLFLQSSAVDTEEKSTNLLKVVLPLIINAYQKKRIERDYLQGKIFILVNKHPQSFKAVITEYLDKTQRDEMEDLVKSHASVSSVDHEPVIELKTFGDD